jgi:hypothetical protein
MGDFSTGVADGMLQGRAIRAESAASGAALALNNARRQAGRDVDLAEQKSVTNLKAMELWRAKAMELDALSKKNAAIGSAGLIVMNAMIKIMEQMPGDQREKFRDQLVQLSRKRILEVDNESKGRPDFLDVEAHMKELHQNKVLGVV